MFSLIRASALANLSHLHSFIKGELLKEHDLNLGNFGGGEQLIGVYINTQVDYILITSIGLRWSHEDTEVFHSYQSIESVEVSGDQLAEPHIKLVLFDQQTEMLPILNATEDLPDVECMHDFLSAVIVLKFAPEEDPTAPSLMPGDVSARHQLIEVLRYYSFKCKPGKDAYLLSMMHGLDDGYPPRWLLRDLGIDENILENPDLWRLLALLLTYPVRPENSLGDIWKISSD